MSVMTSLLTSFSEAEANRVLGSFDIHSLTGAYSSSSLLSVSAPSASVPILPLAGDNQLCVIYNNYTRTINICGGFANLNTINKILHNPLYSIKHLKKYGFLMQIFGFQMAQLYS